MDWFKNIDKIFVVSLQKRAERRIVICDELKKRNIPFRVWYAIDHENGEEGLRQTMTGLLDHCIANMYDRVLVLEDDAHFIQPDEVIDAAMNQLPFDFDLFYFGGTLMTRPERVSPNVLRVQGIYASHAIMYSASGLRLAYEAMVKDNRRMAYDVTLQQYMHKDIRYCSFPMICTQRPGVSDIYKHDPNNHILDRFYNNTTGETDWGAFMQHQYSVMTKNI